MAFPLFLMPVDYAFGCGNRTKAKKWPGKKFLNSDNASKSQGGMVILLSEGLARWFGCPAKREHPIPAVSFL